MITQETQEKKGSPTELISEFHSEFKMASSGNRKNQDFDPKDWFDLSTPITKLMARKYPKTTEELQKERYVLNYCFCVFNFLIYFLSLMFIL